MSDKTALINGLNDKSRDVRLSSLKKLMELEQEEGGRKPASSDVNNHIHTIYSFSPYSPTKAIWMAYNAGLSTAGIMDHDSVSGAVEFIEAGKMAGVAATVGLECRVDFSGTALKGRLINNPDQDTIGYVALHGIPHSSLDYIKEYLKPLVAHRNARNTKMAENLNSIFAKYRIVLDFKKDVMPLSSFNEGGSITERHLLYALSLKLIEAYGKGPGLAGFLKRELALEIAPKLEGYLSDPANPYYAYDLLGVLKSGLVSRFYVKADLECPDAGEFIAFARKTGGIPAYPYLGDVGDSVTGDKKSQKFEDSYLDLLFEVIAEEGFNAVTYMPSRNSAAQLERLRGLCSEKGFFQISGEDINQPRQSFVCEAMRREEFRNLTDSAWALIGHEAAAETAEGGMFSAAAVARYPDLETRIGVYKEIGLKTFSMPF